MPGAYWQRATIPRSALKRGEPPVNAKKFAPYCAGINLVAGCILIWDIINILLGTMAYDVWSAIAGLTIWFKLMADFILSRHAHPGSRSVTRKPDPGQTSQLEGNHAEQTDWNLRRNEPDSDEYDTCAIIPIVGSILAMFTHLIH